MKKLETFKAPVHHYLSYRSINMNDLQVLYDQPKKKEVETVIKEVEKIVEKPIEVIRYVEVEKFVERPLKRNHFYNKVVDIEIVPQKVVQMTPVKVEKEGVRYY